VTRQAHRTARIEARIAPDLLAVVKRAAEIEGRSVSDFVVAAARDAAYRTIEESNVIQLAAEDQVRFVELILNPPPLAPAMERAREAHSKRVSSTP
jgi:uncharacterized protein (DUF1778 family)